MKKLSLYLLLSDSEPDSSGKNILPVTVTGIQSSCLTVCHLLHCLKKKFKDAPIITATLKSFRGIITVGVITVLTTN